MSGTSAWTASDFVVHSGDVVTALGIGELIDHATSRFWVRPCWSNPAVRRLAGGHVMVTGWTRWQFDGYVRITGVWRSGRIDVAEIESVEPPTRLPWPELPGRDDSELTDDEAVAWLASAADAAGPLALTSGGGHSGLRVQVLYINEGLAQWHSTADDAVGLFPSIVPLSTYEDRRRRDDVREHPGGWRW